MDRPLIASLENGDELIVSQLTSYERLDDFFEHKAVVLASDLDEKDFLGKTISFCYQPEEGSSHVKERYFHGYCTQLQAQGEMRTHDALSFEVTASPWTWFLDQRINCRIFQQLTATEIIQSICKEHGFHPQLKINVTAPRKREYSVQFNESDWAYIRRLLASEGWFFYFDQQSSQHNLVISDSNRAFNECGENNAEFFVDSQNLNDAITEWVHQYQMLSGSCATADYNVDLAEPVIADISQSPESIPHRKVLQQFTWPGGFKEKSQGKQVTDRAIKSIDAGYSFVKGKSCLFKFAAGTQFQLVHHPNAAEQQKYYLQEVKHTLVSNEDGRSMEYKNCFCCIPLSFEWKPADPLPKPIMPGLQSATVTGPDNEEIYLDQYHRIKLQFHWDRYGQSNQNSSCWVRVAQAANGDGFGCQFTPRIGDEVLVSFLDNDPDQPLVVGTVYNGKHAQPYTTPSQQGIKLKSTPKAGVENYNELRFECKKDEELINLQAEKDMETLVKNDCSETIKGNFKSLTEKNSSRQVKEDDAHKVEGLQTTEVTKDIRLKTDANYQVTTASDYTQKTDGNYSLTVSGSTATKSTGDLSIDSNANIAEKAANTLSMDATSIHGTGKSSIELSVGGSKISISNTAIEITCAASSIKLSPTGIEISGMQVVVDGKISSEVKGGVSASLSGTANAEVKGTLVSINGNAMTTVKAGAMVQITGALAKIN
ncbi:type VI secretion system Vgr family protein [Endozoicomonas arenosclerae]|uniref:type VI secretion system Vgr family protein n=1 Tax=Endozoicomonas arenosclerae TaxID=1633495 RepID=UPI000782A992|nr:type VI secretion system tip protein TssI/VgrG [Endozoicomonas arenosclerae]